ncbi:YrdB family protein [Antribacter sp. KLBMP9083]|uniref:YrdB family protein n=1 Tax=Antribacter soli TaxID=2910976 RepID=A0AA41U7H6_9MICO|nr:YrdB family protein [Antribacter soli]MCF4121380.1 YrdB family protein [Antribacter soli]
MRSNVRSIALIVRFLLELALVVASAWSAWSLADGVWRWVLALLVPAAVVVVWGRFLSPRAPVALPFAVRIAMETGLFVGAAVALWAAGAPMAGVALAVVWALDRVVLAATAGEKSPLEG